jgi:fatty-acyl-CoA synthase
MYDARYGEELYACIMLKPGSAPCQQEIRELCAGEIAHHKIPRCARSVDMPSA